MLDLKRSPTCLPYWDQEHTAYPPASQCFMHSATAAYMLLPKRASATYYNHNHWEPDCQSMPPDSFNWSAWQRRCCTARSRRRRKSGLPQSHSHSSLKYLRMTIGQKTTVQGKRLTESKRTTRCWRGWPLNCGENSPDTASHPNDFSCPSGQSRVLHYYKGRRHTIPVAKSQTLSVLDIHTNHLA